MALAVIPARFGSTRFPGKVLYPLAGKPMVQWVWERASSARCFRDVIIATDSADVQATAATFGAHAVLTREDHDSGTSRVLEVATSYDDEIIVNVQGDEPLVSSDLLSKLVHALESCSWADIATPAIPLHRKARFDDPNVVKLVMDKERKILYFSRGRIPYCFTSGFNSKAAWEHQGIYAYRREALFAWSELPSSRLSLLEGLEQLRYLEAGYQFLAVVSEDQSPGVNTKEDAEIVESMIRKRWQS